VSNEFVSDGANKNRARSTSFRAASVGERVGCVSCDFNFPKAKSGSVFDKTIRKTDLDPENSASIRRHTVTGYSIQCKLAAGLSRKMTNFVESQLDGVIYTDACGVAEGQPGGGFR
jgi:hypothetical protein